MPSELSRLSLRGLVVFEAAARHGRFAAAAQELAMSQAAVSQHVATLEGDLGTALFTRGHRGVALTPTGQALRHAVEEGLRTPLRDIKCHHVTTSPCCNWELLSYIAGVRYLARVDSSGALKIARTL